MPGPQHHNTETQVSGIYLGQGRGKVDLSEHEHGHVVHGHGWFQVYDIGRDQEVAAQRNLGHLRSRCDELYNARKLPECKWTNDPLVFPVGEHERGVYNAEGVEGVVPFPPNDQQYYIGGIYDPQRSYLTPSAKPGHDMYSEGNGEFNSAWVRLCDFNDHDGCLNLFKERGKKGYHMGRIFQGALDTGYLVEALTAVTLRPRLVKHLFYCHDKEKSIYTVRLYKHGLWHRLELDDYVPVSPPPKEHHQNHGPICCTHEDFPHVMWPSIVEKAYAKLFTKRARTTGDDPADLGGWEAIGAGGRVEDALVMLTGGVAGRWRTRQVSADRLFIYLFERQQDTLFVARVNQPACELYGVKLNPYYPYAVNRAVDWEGRLYIQVFCGAPTCYDGGLSDLSVPYTLLHNENYPETEADGFFWCDVNDFHMYFDTIFECHLTSTPPCAIPGMPPPRLPLWTPSAPDVVARPMRPGMQPQGGINFGMQFPMSDGERVPYFQSVHANPGAMTRHNAPEFNIEIPGDHDGCEIFCSFDQYDRRIMMDSPECQAPADILLKAYVKVNDAVYDHGQKDLWQLCCKSNWFACNHSMIGFTCRHGCKIKVVAEFPDAEADAVEKAVFRVYCNVPNFTVSAMVAKKRHALGELPEGETPAAMKWSLVGSVDAALMENPDAPEEFDPKLDSMRKAEQDINKSLQDLKRECSIM